MSSLYFGIAGFVLYLLYDINSFKWQHPIPKSFFLLGTGLIAYATMADVYAAFRAHAFGGRTDAVLLVCAALAFAALIYSLFFALPFQETYADQVSGRPVYDGGVYALCRHPGVLCFWAMYLFLGLAALPCPLLRHGIVLSLLNTAYALFQDCITFPNTFTNYDAYQKSVPFLIPTSASVQQALRTMTPSGSKEDDT